MLSKYKNTRLYPITIEDFNSKLLPILSKLHIKAGRPPNVSHYEFICATMYVLRTGIPWRDLPDSFGPWHTVYTRFKRWCENGWIWKLFYTLQSQRKLTIDIAWIDSTTIPIHRHGSGALKK